MKTMKRMTSALTVAAAVILSASLFAQTKLDFSGKWTVDTEKTTAANPAGAGGGGGRGGGMGAAPTVITMDANTLKIERTFGENTTTTTYKLDGSESKNTGMGRGGAAGAEQISHAKIDSNKVVIVTTTGNGDQTTSWYMDGAWLVNERTGQNGTVIKTYYKKQ
jgi:hypothetical protein